MAEATPRRRPTSQERIRPGGSPRTSWPADMTRYCGMPERREGVIGPVPVVGRLVAALAGCAGAGVLPLRVYRERRERRGAARKTAATPPAVA